MNFQYLPNFYIDLTKIRDLLILDSRIEFRYKGKTYMIAGDTEQYNKLKQLLNE